MKHLMYMPLLGLGLQKGHRGSAWLANRIKILKHFVIPSLQKQTNKNFILWISVRQEDRKDKQIIELKEYLDKITEFKSVFTYSGVCFYDDKYEDQEARNRLSMALHGAMPDLMDVIGEDKEVIMTIQPSDDLYCLKAVEAIQNAFIKYPHFQAVGFERGYIMNYLTGETANYDPLTNPPFYSIKFKREDFVDPLKHMVYTSLKKDVDKYKIGTPLPSHEYIQDCLNYGKIRDRGFLVGTHQQNISTTWQIPYKGDEVSKEVLKDFGIYEIEPIKLKIPLKKKVYFSLPYRWQRKLRYWISEKLKLKIL